jgi:hypothetical protein
LSQSIEKIKIYRILCSRLYITFIDEDAANVGYNGTTFHQIFGGK